MQRLKIPSRFIALTLELFTNRHNTVITAFGHSPQYDVQIGIDQGEVLSQLLWVIYIDPLLTVLNAQNPTPYCINNDSSLPEVATSTIGYMDDTNLISSSVDGITHMLGLAQEFYSFNNTKINFDKAIFICNRDPTNPLLPPSHTPAPYTFNLASTSFDLIPLVPSESFRFLGVWFSLNLAKSFVKKQCRTEYNLFASKLRYKRLTVDQLRYLHNAVLLPKVEFRLKACLLSEHDCDIIQRPFRKYFKNSLHISVPIRLPIIRIV